MHPSLAAGGRNAIPLHAVTAKEFLVRLHQHVEDRIADPEHVVFCLSHSKVLLVARERLRPIISYGSIEAP